VNPTHTGSVPGPGTAHKPSSVDSQARDRASTQTYLIPGAKRAEVPTALEARIYIYLDETADTFRL